MDGFSIYLLISLSCFVVFEVTAVVVDATDDDSVVNTDVLENVVNVFVVVTD